MPSIRRATLLVSTLIRAALAREVVPPSMVTSLIEKGKGQGYLLSEDIIAAFPNPEDQLDSLDDLYSSLVAEGIEVVDQSPLGSLATVTANGSATNGTAAITIIAPPAKTRDGQEAIERLEEEAIAAGVGDSVRLYLQEIGATDLLTMQEEVWLAKRME